MNKHTPGPWRVDAGFYGDVRAEAGDVAVSVYRDMNTVEIGGQLTLAPVSREEAQANARLIAAAPELLELALELKAELELIAMEEGAEPYNNPRLNEVLAKATGAA